MPVRPLHQRHRRQWGWFALAWLLLGVLLGAQLWRERQEVQERERQHLSQQAGILHDNLARQLNAINHALASLTAYVQQGNGGHERLQNRLQAFSEAMVGVRTLSVLDARGRVTASSRAELVGEDVSQRPYFTAARAATAPDTLVVSPPFRSTLGVWVIVLARVVPGPDGALGGLVVATLDPEAFTTLLASVRYAPDMVAGLTHGDGLRFAMASSPSGPTGPREIDLDRPGSPLRRHLDSGQGASLLTGPVMPAGAPHLLALRTIAPPQLNMDKPLVTGVGRDWGAILAPWRARAWALGAAYLLTGLALAAALGFMQRRWRELALHERKLARQDAQMQERWAAVLQATHQGIWEWDLASEHCYYAPTWKSMLGYDEQDIGDQARDWLERIHPDDGARVQAELQRHLSGQAPWYESMYRMRRKDGGYQWVQDRGRVTARDAQGRPLRLIGTKIDVTERRALRERLDRLVGNVPGMIYQYQLEADGRSHFPYASAGVQDIYGFTAEQLRADAAPVFGRIHPADLPRVSESIRQSAQSLQTWRDEYRVMLPGRGERWLSGQASPQRLDDGAVLWHGYLHDITEAKRQALQLQETERVLQQLMNDMPIGLCMVDAEHRIYFRNRRFLQDFGHAEASAPTLREWSLQAYPDPAYRQQVGRTWKEAVAQAAHNGGQIPERDYRITTRDGALRAVAIGGLVFGGHFLATFVDQTEQLAQSERLRALAYMDGLTGIANRRHFDQQLQAEWRRCRRSGKPLSLVLLDIDYFKQFNDLYGHQRGDECLRTVAVTLRGQLGRSHDLVARYGGEEFVCLLPECDLAGATMKAQALRQAVQALGIAHAGSAVASVVTISLGVACQIPDGTSSPEALLARADAQLYCSKRQGRNQVGDSPELLT
ncbi:diguanylate cyclase domain-containing protein [Alicycliphilus denitrificans]|uniref:diguanylate cyclase domain-containing protein n=1 Tax=Alicycliphilus denitrificans TaxID=179636 RepID=UPI00384C6832